MVSFSTLFLLEESQVSMSTDKLPPTPPAIKKNDESDSLQLEMQTLISSHPAIAINNTSVKSSKPVKRKMLSNTELSNLFRRLDHDNSGELDANEFASLPAKLNMNLPEQYISAIFNEMDTNNTGNLNLSEFNAAYQKVFLEWKNIESGRSSIGKTKPSQEFVRAIRYGSDENNQWLFEEYTTSSLNVSTTKSALQKLVIPMPNASLTFEEQMSKAVASESDVTIEGLNSLIFEDSKNNAANGAKVFWWIDIAMTSVLPSKIEKYITHLGLPNHNHFKGCFRHFSGGMINSDRKSRIFAENGFTSKGPCSSLSFFVQSMWLKKRPLVQLLPNWADALFDNIWCGEFIRNYYKDRFAWFFSTWALQGNMADEKLSALQSAEKIAEDLRKSEKNIGLDNPSDSKFPFHDIRHDGSIPINLLGSSHDREAEWLLSTNDLKKRKPELETACLSASILDQGFGPIATITIRQIDIEEGHDASKLSLDAKSRLGVIGRILAGIRRRVFDVVGHNGTATLAASVADCPFALTLLIMSSLHNFSMCCDGSIQSWMDRLRDEATDLAVSKHSVHTKEVSRILRAIEGYVTPVANLYEELADQAREMNDAAALSEVNAELSPTPAQPAMRRSSLNRTLPDASAAAAAAEAVKSRAVLPENIDKLTQSMDVISSFLGKNYSQYIATLYEGDELLELKGISYWQQKVNASKDFLAAIENDVSVSIDEKRNFYSFMLTVATIFLSPMAILTGYFGMNFDNMEELSSETYPSTPGVRMMWVLCGVFYAVFLILGLHYRILYSAT